ncbi:MAG: DUF1573 domain-containing protein [candidate division Zixibacteria bacterium]|nr:DUF1573 domain-containing protein [candidate division Zixibacteria bacterium]
MSLRANSLALLIVLLTQSLVAAQAKLEYDAVFDFGHVGIDFKVYHTYTLHNRGKRLVKITGLNASCDCTSLTKSDSLIRPRDSVLIHATFDSKNFYGPVNKSFRIYTDDPTTPEIQLFYVATVGQWFNGIKPDPVSVLLLPAHKSRRVTIPNRAFDKITLAGFETSNSHFDINVTRGEATKGANLELDVTPKSDLPKGTYRSSLTLSVGVPAEDDHITLTIPVKIVRY